MSSGKRRSNHWKRSHKNSGYTSSNSHRTAPEARRGSVEKKLYIYSRFKTTSEASSCDRVYIFMKYEANIRGGEETFHVVFKNIYTEAQCPKL
jgi:hypothetical protein